MSCGEEKDFAGWIIDSLKFAAGGECVTGRLPLMRMLRLADVLVDTNGYLEFRLSGFCGEGELAGKQGLHLRVTGNLGLCCQRCLGRVDFTCAIDSRLLLVPEGDVWPEGELEADEYDAIPAGQELCVPDLVEEEVLLVLPLVPRHVDCLMPAGNLAAEKKSAVSPFAALAGLKKR